LLRHPTFKGLPHDGEFANAVSRETGSFEILNHAYKVPADRLIRFQSLWESEGYKVKSQNGQLRLFETLIEPV